MSSSVNSSLPPSNQADRACADFLAGALAREVGRELEAAGVSGQAATGALRDYHRTHVWPARVERVFANLRGDARMREAFAPERYILVTAARASLGRLASARIAPDVQRLMRQEYEFLADPGEDWLNTFESGSRTSLAYAEMALLDRFSAGQLHWVVSGIPRSWMLQLSARDYPRVLRSLWRMGGFHPCFFIHIVPPRSYLPILLERESTRSYYRMAECMELQPEIRGIVTASWLNSDDTLRVSPHLRWMNKVILENGGTVSPIGYTPPDAGFLVGSPERQRLYEAGEYRPRDGLVVWPRRAVLQWLARCRAAKQPI